MAIFAELQAAINKKKKLGTGPVEVVGTDPVLKFEIFKVLVWAKVLESESWTWGWRTDEVLWPKLPEHS